MVWQGPRLGFVAETGRFVAMETPRARFSCLLVFVPCFLLFVFLFFSFFFSLHPGMFILLRVPSSVQQPSATLSKYVFNSTRSSCLCHLYPTPSRRSFAFYSFGIFFVALISRVAFFCCALVPGTLALDLPTLLLQRLVFLCLTVRDHTICISLG